MQAILLATRCHAEFDLTLGNILKCVKTGINLLLYHITTTEIRKK